MNGKLSNEEYNKVKEYLQGGSRLLEVIKAKQEQLHSLEEVSKKVNIMVSMQNTGNDSSKKADTLKALDKLKSELQEDIIRRLVKQKEIIDIIDEVVNKEYSLLLILRYLNGKTWEKVSEEMGYSNMHVVRRLHPKALEEVGEILRRKNIF